MVIFIAEKAEYSQPQGMAGIVRYYDEDKSIVKLKPEWVVAICAGLFTLEVALLLFVK